MRIKHMKATFGTLSDAQLTLHEQLNVIYAPNESGKSTWCAFLKAMLYGIDTSERARAGMLPDKTKYLPWNGKPMEGLMEVTNEGVDISIYRNSKNGPMRSFAASYTGTGEPVPGLSGNNAGEMLTGVPKSVFERSAFVRQSSMAVSSAPELEKRISDIVSSGDDETSFRSSAERLKQWQKTRKSTGRRGRLYELENEIHGIEDKIAMIKELEHQQEENKILLSEAKFRRDELLKKVETGRKKVREDVRAAMKENSTRLREMQDCLDRLRLEEKQLEDRLRDTSFGVRAPSEFEENALADVEKAKELKLKSQEESKIKPQMIAGTGALALMFLLMAFVNGYMLILSLIMGIATGFLFIRDKNIRAAAESALDEYQAIIEKYGVVTPDEIGVGVKLHKHIWEKYVTACEKVRSAENELKSLRQKQESAEGELLKALDFNSGDSEVAMQTRAFNEAEKEFQAIRERKAMDRGRMENIGDLSSLESELSKKQRDAKAVQLEYDAITLALNTLSEANAEIQTRFSPLLSKRATEIFSRITGGRYDQMTLNRELSPMAKRRDDITPRESLYLSAGALDQLYLSLRLAICELALPKETKCPLILDDILVNFDRERTELAMEYFKEVSKERQVILFTCRNELPSTGRLEIPEIQSAYKS